MLFGARQELLCAVVGLWLRLPVTQCGRTRFGNADGTLTVRSASRRLAGCEPALSLAGQLETRSGFGSQPVLVAINLCCGRTTLVQALVRQTLRGVDPFLFASLLTVVGGFECAPLSVASTKTRDSPSSSTGGGGRVRRTAVQSLTMSLSHT